MTEAGLPAPPGDADGGEAAQPSTGELLSRLLKGLIIALFGGYLFGAAAFLLDCAGDGTGLARQALVPFLRRGLTAEAPARLERYQWFAEMIPDKEYHGGERIVAWPEIVLSYQAADGRTRWLRVRGPRDNTDAIPTYMAHFAGIFGLPWIEFVLPRDVMRRLSYDPRRPTGWSNQPPNSLSDAEAARYGATYNTWLVASTTDQVMEQSALMWAAPSPRLSVRYDPNNPAHAWPAQLLDAFSQPLSGDVQTWVEAVMLAVVGGALLWVIFATVLKLRPVIAVVVWLAAMVSFPLWTAHAGVAAQFLGVSRMMTAMFSKILVNPVKLQRVEVESAGRPGTNHGLRWSLPPEEGGALLARLAPPSPHLSPRDLLSRGTQFLGGAPGSGVPQRFATAIRSSLIALPDEQLAPLLDGVCESNRSAELIYILRPELERIAKDPHRPDAVRERAGDLASHRAFCH